MPHHEKLLPLRPPEPAPSSTGDVLARLSIVCTCRAELEVRTTSSGRLVASVVHGAGCPMGALVEAGRGST